MLTDSHRQRILKRLEKEYHLLFVLNRHTEVIQFFYPLWRGEPRLPQLDIKPEDVANLMNITRREARQFMEQFFDELPDPDFMVITTREFCKRTGADELTIQLCLAYLDSEKQHKRAIKP